MIKRQLYERPDITVLQLEESCGLLAGSDKNVTINKEVIINGIVEDNPKDGIDAKKNNIWGTNGLWND